MKWRFLVLLSLIVLGQGQSQSDPLSQYVQEAWSQNLGLQGQALAQEAQASRVASSKLAYRPNVAFNSDHLWSRGGRTINFPVGDLFNPIAGTLNQLTGSENFPTNLENVDEQLVPRNFLDSRLELTMPLYNSSISYNQRIQESLLKVEEAALASQRNQIRLEVKRSYYQYWQTQELLGIYDSTAQLLQEILRLNQKLVKADKITSEAIYAVEYDLAQLASDRAGAIQQQALAATYFNTLLHRDLDAEILPSSSTSSDQALDNEVNLADEAIKQRPEMEQLLYGIQASQLAKELQDKSNRPTVGLNLQAGVQSLDYEFNSNSFYTTAAVGVSWTIYDSKRKSLRSQEAELIRKQRELEREDVAQRIRLQVRQANYSIAAAQAKLRAESALLTSAERNFALAQKRYKANKALLVEYLDARTKYSNARISRTIAQYDLLIRQAEMEAAIGR